MREGSLQRVGIVHSPERLPAVTHDRVILSDLLVPRAADESARPVHAQVDADGDGILDEHSWEQIRAMGAQEPVSASPAQCGGHCSLCPPLRRTGDTELLCSTRGE